MRPEVELLFCCARTSLDARTASRIRTVVGKEVDWDYLVRMARRHQIMPLLYRNLEAACREAVPEQRMHQLRAYFQLSAHRNLARGAELLRLVTRFDAASIAALPFKGPLLAASVYGSLSLREFSDLDFLVAGEQFAATADVLVADGYRIETDFGWETHFYQPSTGTCVDLHRSIVPAYFPEPFRFDELWAGRRRVPLQGVPVPAPSAEDLLLILSAQWAKNCCDRRPRIAQLCDLGELLRASPQLEWDRVLERASSMGIGRMVHLYVRMAGDLLGSDVPHEFRQGSPRLRPAASLRSQAEQWLFRETDNHPEASETAGPWTYPHRFHLALRERPRDKAVYAARRLAWIVQAASTPGDKDLTSIRLPRPVHFLYYVIRPFRLLRTYRGGLVGQLWAKLRHPS